MLDYYIDTLYEYSMSISDGFRKFINRAIEPLVVKDLTIRKEDGSPMTESNINHLVSGRNKMTLN